MRLEEIKQGNAAEQHVQQLKTNAKAAKERAKQMKASADQSAEVDPGVRTDLMAV